MIIVSIFDTYYQLNFSFTSKFYINLRRYITNENKICKRRRSIVLMWIIIRTNFHVEFSSLYLMRAWSVWKSTKYVYACGRTLSQIILTIPTISRAKYSKSQALDATTCHAENSDAKLCGMFREWISEAWGGLSL